MSAFTTDTIEPAIDAALRAHWIWHCRPPASIRVNPADAANLVRSWLDRQARELAEIARYWPELAATRRAEVLHTPAAAAISHWVDNYSGGVEIPFIMDATTPRGRVHIASQEETGTD